MFRDTIVGAGVLDGPCGRRSEAGGNGRPQGSPLQTSRNTAVLAGSPGPCGTWEEDGGSGRPHRAAPTRMPEKCRRGRPAWRPVLDAVGSRRKRREQAPALRASRENAARDARTGNPEQRRRGDPCGRPWVGHGRKPGEHLLIRLASSGPAGHLPLKGKAVKK